MSELSTHAIVIPAALDAPVYVIDWPYDPALPHQDVEATLRILYREIGCDCVDATPILRTGLGAFVGWSDDVSLTYDVPAYNDRAIGLFRAFGYQVAALAGTIVVTGGPDEIGDTLPLPVTLCAYLMAGFAAFDGGTP